MTCKGIDLVGSNRKQDIKHGQCMYEVCISARLIRKTACMEKVLTYSGIHLMDRIPSVRFTSLWIRHVICGPHVVVYHIVVAYESHINAALTKAIPFLECGTYTLAGTKCRDYHWSHLA